MPYNTILRPLIILVFSLALFACNSESSTKNESEETPPTTDQQSASTSTANFVLSKHPVPEPGSREDNWCYAGFGPSIVVNAEKVNTNRRYFYLPAGISKLAVGRGARMTLLLKPLPNGNVEVFTGSNFPACLSQPVNFDPAGGAASMRYNNGKNIDFRMDLDVQDGQYKVSLEFPPGINYGISVNNCLDCS